MKEEMIKVIVLEPKKRAEVRTIKNDLTTLQSLVDGYIEVVYPSADNMCVIVNDEGKFNGSEMNRALKDDSGDMYDFLFGTCIICGLGVDDDGYDNGEFASLNDELITKYLELYKYPEMLINMNGRYIAIPLK